MEGDKKHAATEVVFAGEENDFAANFGHLGQREGDADAIAAGPFEEQKTTSATTVVPPVPFSSKTVPNNRFMKQYSNLIEGDSENFAGLERVQDEVEEVKEAPQPVIHEDKSEEESK